MQVFEENYEILQPRQQRNSPGFNQALPEHVYASRYFPLGTERLSPQKISLAFVIPLQFTNGKNSTMVGKILFQSDVTNGLRGKRSWPTLKCYSKIRLTLIHSAVCLTTGP